MQRTYNIMMGTIAHLQTTMGSKPFRRQIFHKKSIICLDQVKKIRSDAPFKAVHVGWNLKKGTLDFETFWFALLFTIITCGLYILNPLFEGQKHFFSRRFFRKILPLCMVSIQERFLIKSGLCWRAYGIWTLMSVSSWSF